MFEQRCAFLPSEPLGVDLCWKICAIVRGDRHHHHTRPPALLFHLLRWELQHAQAKRFVGLCPHQCLCCALTGASSSYAHRIPLYHHRCSPLMLALHCTSVQTGLCLWPTLGGSIIEGVKFKDLSSNREIFNLPNPLLTSSILTQTYSAQMELSKINY